MRFRVAAVIRRLAAVAAMALAAAAPGDAARQSATEPVPAILWNMSASVDLTYDDHVTAFAAQGLSNRNASTLLMYDIGAMNFDWPQADSFWVKYLSRQGRATFEQVDPTLCALLMHPKVASAVAGGIIVYDGDQSSVESQFGDGYSAAIALTLAGQRALLPVSADTLARHACLSSLPVTIDLRELLRGKSRLEAWDWAVSALLPRSSKSVVFNLNHYRVEQDPVIFRKDKQSNATRSSIDYAVQQNAFVLDLESHSTKRAGQTAPWGPDDQLLGRVFDKLDPLFDAYGWSDDEFSWTNETSHHGGTIMCSFASPNLSFWAQLPLARGKTRADKLPENDRGMPLDQSKFYVTFETNEGDTPRILVSNMASAWAQKERGSVPVAWAIDPLLAVRFPSLFDYYVETATRNDSFIAGTAGAGYVFLNQLDDAQIKAYGERVGSLTAQYGPHVFDTYGYANLSTHVAYARAAAAGGGAPTAFVTQPNWGVPQPQAYDAYHCKPDGANVLVGKAVKTPLICTPGDPNLFYYSSSLNDACPSCDLAQRISKAAHKHAPPHFVTVYGGLQAGGGLDNSGKKGFWRLLGDTVDKIGSDFVVVGATELARLARQALLAAQAPESVE